MRQPIVTHDGMILDGGNRYRACLDAGIKPTFAKFSGGNLVSFVLSANMHRRHLSAGQQAAIVASAQDWSKAQPMGNPSFGVQRGNVAPLATIADRAAQSGASKRTQRMADKVAKASPALAKQVARGEISLYVPLPVLDGLVAGRIDRGLAVQGALKFPLTGTRNFPAILLQSCC